MPNLTRFSTGFGIGSGSRECRLVSFTLADRHYGIDVDDVFGIYHGNPLIPTPELSEFVDGEVHVSGQRVPVLNLRRFLGLDESTKSHNPWILTVNQPGGPVGLAVDRVNEVVRLEANDLQKVDDSLHVPMSEYITERAHQNGRWLFIPDMNRLLRDALV